MTKTKTKTTRRALLMSALSLLLCVSMLIGSTFAWFTDSVTSAGNIIKSGTLDVEMYWAKGNEDPNADATAWTDASTGAIFNNKNWEPGYVEVRHIKISNVGTLALKYQLHIFANGDVSKLTDAIDVYFVDPAMQVTDRTALNGIDPVGTLTEVLAGMPGNASGDLLATETDTVTLALKMRESAGNEYQGLEVGSDFVIQLLATQLTSEEDSFDDQYDANAEFLPVNESAAIVNNNGKLGESVVMTAKMPYGTIKVTVPAGAQLSSADVASLKLTVKNAANGYSGQLTANQVATGYEIYVDGIADYLNPFVDATGRKLYNYSDISVALPIGAGRNDVKVYKDGMMPSNTWASYDSATGVVTFSADYLTPFSQAKKSNITVVYTKLSEAEKQLNEALENITAGDSVTINSTADNTVSVNNIADALNGSSNIILVGNGTDSTTVASNGATVTADSLTVKDMTIQSVGTTTIKGNNTTIEGVKYQSAGASYGLTVSGSDTTIKNTTVEGANATQGLVLIASGSDTATSVTNVSGLTVTDTSMFGSSSGFTFKNINGTLNLSNSTIKVGGAAFGFGPSNSKIYGYVNVTNTTFDSTSASISTVKASTFDTVVFENTWNTSAIRFTVGGATNTFTNCEFKADLDFQSANYANKNVTLTFNNCTYNGVAITADNIKDHFVFNNGSFGLQNRDRLTVIVNGVTVTL
ncbi:MAG: hypothetical protein E7461_03250 [Ruminococcaceae bacterium]|nr:hypothetical protein [Oscillospiraceae bacterium]